MKLDQFLTENSLTDSEFARSIESGRVAVGRYRRGERMPETTIMEKIIQITSGAVTAQDMHETRLEWLGNLPDENLPDASPLRGRASDGTSCQPVNGRKGGCPSEKQTSEVKPL